VIPSVVAAFASSPSTTVVKGGAGLTTCNYANGRSSAHQVLQYLESLKNMEASREVMSPTLSILQVACIFVDFILHICVASTAKLEAVNKALVEERASWQVVDQALSAAQESNSALTRDLQSFRASTDTLKEELGAA
jgi:hypothetical protein